MEGTGRAARFPCPVLGHSRPWAPRDEPVSKRQRECERERESSGRQSATRARPDSGDKVGSTKKKKKKSRLRLPCRWSLFFSMPPTGDRQKGDFRTVSKCRGEQLRRGKPGEWTGALPVSARLSICLGRWRVLWMAGNHSPLRRHLLPACPQPRQHPPPPVFPPDLHLRSQGRRQALHCAHLHARVLLLVPTSDAGRRAAAAATNQDGSGRAIAASAASAGLGLLRVLGAMAAGPTGYPSFFIPARPWMPRRGHELRHIAGLLATRLDMQPGGYFMSRLDKMWDEGDMHAARSPIVDKSSGGEGNTQMGLETAVRARGRGEGRSRLVRFSLMLSCRLAAPCCVVHVELGQKVAASTCEW